MYFFKFNNIFAIVNFLLTDGFSTIIIIIFRKSPRGILKAHQGVLDGLIYHSLFKLLKIRLVDDDNKLHIRGELERGIYIDLQ